MRGNGDISLQKILKTSDYQKIFLEQLFDTNTVKYFYTTFGLWYS